MTVVPSSFPSLHRTVVSGAAALLLAGCATSPWRPDARPGVSPAPETRWTPPAGAARSAPTPSAAPALSLSTPATLAELIDVGLSQHPDTRAAWLAARSAAAALESAKGARYPQVDLTAQAGRGRQTGSSGSGVVESYYGGQFGVSYLLLDFGGRKATIEQARESLVAADWTHNAAIADRVLAITSAYYAQQAALALDAAGRAGVKEATTNLEAAEARHNAGLATLADVLQAKTARSRAQLALETYDGQVATSRGQLNNVVGLPVNRPTLAEALPAELPLDQVQNDIDQWIADAEARRPELAAALAQARRAEAQLTAVKSAGRPQVTLSGNLGFSQISDPSTRVDLYGAALALHLPVFTGFTQRMNERRAEADLEAARARVEALRQQVDLQVFRSYHDAQTALQRVRTSHDLVQSATQNQEAALGRYQAGVGSVVELVTAQTALEDARSQEVQARADWLTALAQLARDSGASATPADGPRASIDQEKGYRP